MKKRYYLITLFLFAALYMNVHVTYAQKEKEVKTNIEAIVEDSEGNPVVNAELFSDNSYAKTGADGRFSIAMASDAFLIVRAKGYETLRLHYTEAGNMSKFILEKSEFLYAESDMVNLGFRKAYQGDVVGAVSSLNAPEIRQYDNTTNAISISYGRALGLNGNSNVRGLGINYDMGMLTSAGAYSSAAMLIVDGLPRNWDFLKGTEIETITVLKDANAVVLYGAPAINGVIVVTTKRGESSRKQNDITVRYGVRTRREMPNYLNSADYMEWYNQARRNDGLTDLYSSEDIQNYRTGNKYRYPDIDYFSSDYLKPFSDNFDLNGELSGGNNFAKFYANYGWGSSGDFYKIGYGKEARENIFNVRLNADLKINDWINTETDGAVILYNNKQPRMQNPDTESYFILANTIRPNEYSPLLPIDLMPADNILVNGRKKDVDGIYLLGGNPSNLRGLLPTMYGAGTYEMIFRDFSINNRINFDFDKWIKGLSFHTNVSFNLTSGFSQSVVHTFSVYQATWDSSNRITGLTQMGDPDAKSTSPLVDRIYLRRRFAAYGMLSYDRTFNDTHHFTGNLFTFGSIYKRSDDYQGSKNAHLGLQLGYAFNKRYMFDFSGVLVNSMRLAPGHQGDFSPTAGIAWVMSNEDFMSSASNIDFLKIRLSAGIIKSDLTATSAIENNLSYGSQHFLWDDLYGTTTSFAWNEGSKSRSSVQASRGKNVDLGFINRKDLNIGLEAVLFEKSVGFTANYFYTTNEGYILRPSTIYPAFYSPFVPFSNYNNVKYQGFEAGLNYTKSVQDWTFFAGVNVLYRTSERTRTDEVYAWDYQYRNGYPIDAQFGLEAIGLFQDQNEIDNSPRQTFGTVRPGDIKYKDQNGDGIIDANDEVFLRRTNPPFYGNLQLRVSYKGVTLMALGTGQIQTGSFNSDYYRPDGNLKYSEEVLKSWTPETKSTAIYPRLSTSRNENNRRTSDFWFYNANYFNINRIQLTYQLPGNVTKAVLMKNWEIFAQCTAPFVIAPNKRMILLSTGYPSVRSFTLGLKASF